jgi:hypothetical protein
VLVDAWPLLINPKNDVATRLLLFATSDGCHVIGERAVDIVEVAAIAIAAGMRVDDLARIPLSYPTYAGILVNVAVKAAHELGLAIGWQAHQAA